MSGEVSKLDEEAYLQFVQINIELRAEELKHLAENPGGATSASPYNIARYFKNRELPDPNSPYFTRVDLQDGEIRYFGHIFLKEADKSPVIPQSHKQISRRLIRSRNSDHGLSVLPLSEVPEVVRRIRFIIKNGEIVNLTTEIGGSNSLQSNNNEILVPELVRETMLTPRGTTLTPVDSTLQPEQFRITKLASDSILAVQGPPGSGKTIVLLERLSRIAYKDPEVRAKKMVLIGPNAKFLEYVEDVLKALGNTEILTRTVEQLAAWEYSNKSEEDVIETIKASRTYMENIVDSLILDLPQVLDKNYEFKISELSTSFTVKDSYELLAFFREDDSNYVQIREKAIAATLAILTERFFMAWEEQGRDRLMFKGDPKDAIQQMSSFKTMIRNMFPDVLPEDILKRLKSSSNDFLRYASAYMEVEDLENWLEYVIPQEFEINKSDIPILDYIDYCLFGVKRENSFGHIAIDEAQNLNPMQLRMIARRVDHPSAISMTGDLAQAIGVIYYEKWEDIVDNFDSPRAAEEHELRTSYRVPKEIIEYSKKFLEKSAVKVNSAQPFLDIPDSLNLEVVSRSGQIARVKELVNSFLGQDLSVLVISTEADSENFQEIPSAQKLNVNYRAYNALDVKGLEFDVVLVIDPVAILRELNYETSRAARLMYVVTTRSTKKLFLIGPGKEQLVDPISYYEKLSEEYEVSSEVGIEDYLESVVETAETNQDRNLLSALENPTSIPSLCDAVGVSVSTTNSKHSDNGWISHGSTQVRCIECASKPQLFFTRHVIGKDFHFGALVCMTCEIIRDEDYYSADDMLEVFSELDVQNQIKLKCEDCR